MIWKNRTSDSLTKGKIYDLTCYKHTREQSSYTYLIKWIDDNGREVHLYGPYHMFDLIEEHSTPLDEEIWNIQTLGYRNG